MIVTAAFSPIENSKAASDFLHMRRPTLDPRIRSPLSQVGMVALVMPLSFLVGGVLYRLLFGLGWGL